MYIAEAGYDKKFYQRKRGIISEQDLNTLKAWLSSIVVPFNGFVGKIHFTKTTHFPRYKFTEYSREKNNIIKRVRDIDNADAVVIDVNEYEKLLEAGLRVGELSSLKKSSLVPLEFAFDVYKHKPGNPLFSVYWNESSKDYIQMSFLCYLYNEYQKKSFKIISVLDLSQSLGKQYEAIDFKKSEQLSRLFTSKSQDDIKLAMEIMTNCDLEASHFHLCLLFSQHISKMKISYWQSTSFKAFRESFDSMGLRCECISYDIYEAVTEYLLLENKLIFEEDLEYAKKLIGEKVDSEFNMEDTGFKLSNYSIDLKINLSQVIKNPVLIQEEVQTLV